MSFKTIPENNAFQVGVTGELDSHEVIGLPLRDQGRPPDPAYAGDRGIFPVGFYADTEAMTMLIGP